MILKRMKIKVMKFLITTVIGMIKTGNQQKIKRNWSKLFL